MFTTKIRGDIGENIAAEYLKGLGYEIMERNYRTELGEIDIIAAGEGYLIFVEVKTRLNENHGYGADAVNYRKRKNIVYLTARCVSILLRFIPRINASSILKTHSTAI